VAHCCRRRIKRHSFVVFCLLGGFLIYRCFYSCAFSSTVYVLCYQSDDGFEDSLWHDLSCVRVGTCSLTLSSNTTAREHTIHFQSHMNVTDRVSCTQAILPCHQGVSDYVRNVLIFHCGTTSTRRLFCSVTSPEPRDNKLQDYVVPS